MASSFRLSRSLIDDLDAICATSIDNLTNAIDAIDRRGVTIKRSVLRTTFEERVGPEVAEALERFVFFVATAQRRGRGATPDILGSVRRSLIEQGWDEDRLADWEARRSLLSRLLVSPSVLGTAKAVDLSYDFARLYLAARVLTDIRPVFDDAREAIIGATITQTLRLDYITPDGTESTLSAAMDMDDLRELQKACSKAIDKTDVIKRLIEEKGGIEITTPGEDVPK